jgi:uncharacterized repeat protein (TIGR02543 family)
LFKGGELYGMVSELIKVRQNLASKETYTLTEADLNIIYIITYDLDGGELDSAVENPGYYRSTDAVFELPTPTRKGYTFEGWHAETNDGAKATDIPQESEGDKNFYAEWSLVTYTINYELDEKGSNHAENPQDYTVEDLPITLKDPTPNGSFRFLRWYVEGYPDTPVTTISQGETGEKTFHAKWTPVYPINYELGAEGSDNGGNPPSYTVEDLPLPLKAPTPNGSFHFLRWYVEGFPNSAVTTIPAGSSGAKTFYAGWHKDGDPLTSAADIKDYIINAAGGNSAENPVILPPVNINLADGTNGWAALLSAIQTANKFVTLDLSVCAMTGTEFDPGTANTGESKIVSLVLPEAATSVKANDYPNFTFRYFSALTSVTGSKITTIGDYAFANCSALETVSFPKAVTIGSYAFYRCTSLETIDLPDSLASIGAIAFQHCTSLASIDLPDGLTTLARYAFSASALESITIPAGITIIRNYTFENCKSLKSVVLPATLTSIEQDAFFGCALMSIDLPATLGSIGQNGIRRCESLEVIISRNTTPPSLGTMALHENPSVVWIYVPDANVEAYKTANGWKDFSDKIRPLTEYTAD